MEKVFFYVIKGLLVFELLLGLFNFDEDGVIFEEDYGILRCYLCLIMLFWVIKCFNEFGGDISQFCVVKLYFLIFNQIVIVKIEFGDENNQDIFVLVGKVDICKLEEYLQNDVDVYSYLGVFCWVNQGLMEFVEMFKVLIKVLYLLLIVIQEGNYNSIEGFGVLFYSGIILVYFNELEWYSFCNNKNNEVFIDCIYIVKVLYCLCVVDEIKIYDKLLVNSLLVYVYCVLDILKMFLQFFVLLRLKELENLNIYLKMWVYDGENLKDIDFKVKLIQEYCDLVGVDEGMVGFFICFVFKIFFKVFNFDLYEVVVNLVYLFYVFEQQIEQEQFQLEICECYLCFIKEYLVLCYVEFIGKEIQIVYLEFYSEYGQNIFDCYVLYVDFWIQDQEYCDLEIGEIFNCVVFNEELEKIEKFVGISNLKDFCNEIVNFVLCVCVGNNGKNLSWLFYEKLCVVIEKKMFFNIEDLFLVISFNVKVSKEDQQKYNDFVKCMVECGYIEKQVCLLLEWYLWVCKLQQFVIGMVVVIVLVVVVFGFWCFCFGGVLQVLRSIYELCY